MKTIVVTSMILAWLLSSCTWDVDTQKVTPPTPSHVSTWVMVTDTSTGNMMTPQSSSGSR